MKLLPMQRVLMIVDTIVSLLAIVGGWTGIIRTAWSLER